VARNRKRAKERRARRPQPVGSTRIDREEEAPNPLAHAAPDVELAEAQLAIGRPEPEPGEEEELAQLAAEEEEEEEEELEADGELDGGGAGAELVAAEAPSAAPAARARPGNRLIHFLQGSWRELQRVQWPDRRQVMQATGVVIGFVIVAGVFLGVADYLAQKLVNYILK
jgi:preprotein translocase SecE subunit